MNERSKDTRKSLASVLHLQLLAAMEGSRVHDERFRDAIPEYGFTSNWPFRELSLSWNHIIKFVIDYHLSAGQQGYG